ncbi:lytic transglycosylase domain-containing protein [Aquitalea aquatica]|uniref:Lytic transglycosylase domain-containing protein n=1 Tax=Aquitalea aquatica TaxID=3044273 RepID=A0A838XYH0_9NEIS|nr:lytic transglycosylase domain-containing protein [Aquitalea magnusonii]MBA4707426.1 lytic transglycosylase domain-containing protein [Aquitalea magnusonii]
MRFITIFLAWLACFASSSVHADLYGFVDEQGQVHLANRQLDERYQLYQKSLQSGASSNAALDDATTPGLGATLSSDNRLPAPAAARVDGLKSVNAPAYNTKLASQYKHLIDQTAREFKLDANLLHSIVTVESGYNPQALSPKGAVGLMQVIPATGERFGVTELSDPRQNLRAGARYLRFLLAQFNNDLPLAIAAYNAGEGAVQKYRNTIPPYEETRDYVAKVLASYEKRGGLAYQNSLRNSAGKTRVRAVILPATLSGTTASAL